MPAASGLGSQMGIALETVYGTPVAPARFMEYDSEALALDQTFQDAVGLKANRTVTPIGRMRATTRQAAGAIPMDVPTKGFGLIPNFMHGLVATVVQQGATPAWLQTHLIGTSQPNKFGTLQFNKPTSQGVDTPFTYPGSVLTAASFTIETAGILKVNTTWDAMDERTPTTTPAGLALGAATYPTGVTSWVGTIGVTIMMGGVAVAVARSMTLEWTQPYKTDRFFLGASATKMRPIPNGFATITGSLDCEWFDATAYGYFRAGAPIAIDFKFENDVISGAFKEMIQFTIPAAQVRGGSPNVSGPDVLDVTVPFTVGDDGTNAPLTIKYQSTDVAV